MTADFRPWHLRNNYK